MSTTLLCVPERKTSDTVSVRPGMGLYEAELRRRLHGRVADLTVEDHDGGLILQGWCVSYYAKQVAQHAAMSVTGMPIVANRIEVARSAGRLQAED